MTTVGVVAILLKALLGVSVLGVVGKLGWPHSRLFRSHRDTDRHAAEAEKVAPAAR